MAEADVRDKSRTGKSYSLPNTSLWKTYHQSETSHRKFRYSIAGWLKSSVASLEGDPWFTQSKGKSHSKVVSRLPLVRRIEKSTVNSDKPKTHEAKIVIWSDLTMDAIDRLNECHSYDNFRQVVASMFLLDNSKHNLKDGIILDLFYYTLQFAREEHFSAEKTSTFFSIIKKIFEVCTETPYGNLNHTFDYFKELLFCHAINQPPTCKLFICSKHPQQPPTCIELFTHEEVMSMVKFTLNTFFRHFKLYKYVFTPSVRLDLTFNYVGVLPSPPQSPGAKTDSNIYEDKPGGEEGYEADDIDAEKLKAQEELKRIVTDFLTKEAKKVEVNIDQHLKATVDALNAKIDPLIDTGLKMPKGKKKN